LQLIDQRADFRVIGSINVHRLHQVTILLYIQNYSTNICPAGQGKKKKCPQSRKRKMDLGGRWVGPDAAVRARAKSMAPYRESPIAPPTPLLAATAFSLEEKVFVPSICRETLHHILKSVAVDRNGSITWP
jgi:hypothetical protein